MAGKRYSTEQILVKLREAVDSTRLGTSGHPRGPRVG